MPNWITVKVKVKNPKVLTEKFLSEYTEEELNREDISSIDKELGKYVDFEKLIPTPTDMNIKSGGTSYIDDTNYYNFQSEKVNTQREFITPVLEKTYKSGLSQEAYVFLTLPSIMNNPTLVDKFKELYTINDSDSKNDITNVLKGFYNLKKYGAVDWYDFHVKNWGTKWNAYTDYIDEERGFVEFKTAWSCPFAILEELAKYTDIAVSYADEDIGNNYGIFTIVNGNYKDVIPYRHYLDLNNTEKVQAIAMATALTMGEIYDINEDIFDTEEVSEEFGMTPKQVMTIAQQAVDHIQEITTELDLV